MEVVKKELLLGRNASKNIIIGVVVGGVIFVTGIILLILFLVGVFDSGGGGGGGGSCGEESYWANISVNQIQYYNDLTLRFQWNSNHGYCGESSMLTIGLFFGQYFSQYDVREITSGFESTNSPQIDGEFLLGYNDAYAAQQLRYNFTQWDHDAATTNGKDTKSFLLWVKKEVLEGHHVTIGVYTNEYLFYCKSNPNAGDPTYDHIVSILGIDTSTPSDTSTFNGNDILYFDDHGLWGDGSPAVGDSTSGTRYILNYTFDEIMGTRQEANDQTTAARVYTLPSSESEGNYGISVHGILDSHGDTLPISLFPSQNYESPEIKDGSNTRPASSSITLTIKISSLTPSVSYVLYSYSSIDNVPTSSFNSHASSASSQQTFSISSGSSYTLTEDIQSSDQRIYRCVRADAP